MTIYTIRSQEFTKATRDSGNNRCIVGSYNSRGNAIDACVAYIMERMETRDDLVESMANCRWNEDTAAFFSRRRDGGSFAIKHGCVNKLRLYLRDELGGKGEYTVYDGDNLWEFYIEESELEGDMWTTVIWGDSDQEDPNFTTPVAESFTSKEKAIRSFYYYAYNLKRDLGMGVSDGFQAFVFNSLREDGRCQVDLDDGLCISCVLQHTDMKSIKE